MLLIDDIILILETGEKFKYDNQDILREYILDKSNPLDKRFKIWSKWCDKTDHSYVISATDSPIIRKMLNDCWPDDYHRYRTYDWQFFLDWVENGNDTIKYISSVDEFKEHLIDINFGSFYMDW